MGFQNRYKLLRMPRLSGVVAGLGALLFAFWIASVLQWVVPLYTSFSEGSGGIGAVSVGLLGGEPMMFAAAILANRLIARWARTSSPTIRRLHVLHSVTLVMIPILLIVWMAGGLSGFLSPGGQTMVAAVLFIGQLALMSVLLALFAWQPRGALDVRT